jgi:hypothetical protein
LRLIVAELKKKLEPLTDWIRFEIDTDIIDPPEISLRFRPVNPAVVFDMKGGDQQKYSSYIIEVLVDAIVEWDLRWQDKPYPCTEEAKRPFIMSIVGAFIKDKPGRMFGFAALDAASDQSNFLKN